MPRPAAVRSEAAPAATAVGRGVAAPAVLSGVGGSGARDSSGPGSRLAETAWGAAGLEHRLIDVEFYTRYGDSLTISQGLGLVKDFDSPRVG